MVPIRFLVGSLDMNDDVAIATAGFQLSLHAGSDFLVHLLHVAAQRVAWAGPGVCKINTDHSRLAPKTYAPLKAPVLIIPRTLVECFLQHFV